MSREYHIATDGNDLWEGTAGAPFRTISKAAAIAMPGDRIVVHSGVYREWINPANGGTSSQSRIIYEAASGEKVSIKGSERIQNWERIEGNVWKAEVPNSLFGNFNPFAERLYGDWLETPREYSLHLGGSVLKRKIFL